MSKTHFLFLALFLVGLFFVDCSSSNEPGPDQLDEFLDDPDQSSSDSLQLISRIYLQNTASDVPELVNTIDYDTTGLYVKLLSKEGNGFLDIYSSTGFKEFLYTYDALNRTIETNYTITRDGIEYTQPSRFINYTTWNADSSLVSIDLMTRVDVCERYDPENPNTLAEQYFLTGNSVEKARVSDWCLPQDYMETVMTYDENGNVIKAVQTQYVDGTVTTFMDMTYSYSSNPNPFYKPGWLIDSHLFSHFHRMHGWPFLLSNDLVSSIEYNFYGNGGAALPFSDVIQLVPSYQDNLLVGLTLKDETYDGYDAILTFEYEWY